MVGLVPNDPGREIPGPVKFTHLNVQLLDLWRPKWMARAVTLLGKQQPPQWSAPGPRCMSLGSADGQHRLFVGEDEVRMHGRSGEFGALALKDQTAGLGRRDMLGPPMEG